MRIAFLAFLFCQFQFLAAQEIRVVGHEDQLPLINATVSITDVKGQKSYISADVNGSIRIKDSQFHGGDYLLLTASYLGYEKESDTLYIDEQQKVIELKSKGYTINDVVITAQYAPTTIEKSVHKVNVISRQKIDNMAAVNVQDVLSNELNVRLSRDNILGAGMSLQGISGQNVKILIDGVPVIGRLDGQIDLSQINLNNVQRLEIVEGPLSVNYGSNALAGTINVITKKNNSDKFSAGVEAYTENIGTYNLTARSSFRLNQNHGFQLSVGRNYFDGWSPEDDFLPTLKSQQADSGRAKQWNPKEQYFGRLQYHYDYQNFTFSYKGEWFDETIKNYGLPRRSANTYVAFDDYYKTRRIDNAVFAKGNINDRYHLKWLAAYNDFKRIKEARRKDLVSMESTLIPENAANDTQDTSKFNLFTSRGSISSTIDSGWFNYEIGYDINLEKAEGTRIENGTQSIGDYAAFFSTELEVLENLLIKPAVRYSYNTNYNAPLTPSVNIKYARKNSIIRFSYAKGFRAPSLKELYFNFDDINHSLFGNPNLKAERSNNFSASIQQKFLLQQTLLKAELSAFYNKIYDQINFAQSNINTGDTLIYFNIDENQTKGLNLNLSLILDQLRINVGGSYIGRSNRLANENQVDDFSYSTELKANFTYEMPKPKLSFSVFTKYQGALPGFSYNSSGEVIKQTIESYQMVDATITKRLWKNQLSVAVGCKNILDVQNIDASISNSAHSGGGSSIPIGTGRTVFIKLGLQFNKPQ